MPGLWLKRKMTDANGERYIVNVFLSKDDYGYINLSAVAVATALEGYFTIYMPDAKGYKDSMYARHTTYRQAAQQVAYYARKHGIIPEEG